MQDLTNLKEEDAKRIKKKQPGCTRINQNQEGLPTE